MHFEPCPAFPGCSKSGHSGSARTPDGARPRKSSHGDTFDTFGPFEAQAPLLSPFYAEFLLLGQVTPFVNPSLQISGSAPLVGGGRGAYNQGRSLGVPPAVATAGAESR